MNTKTAVVKRLEGLTFVGKTDTDHWLVMDASREGGGSGASVRPKELLRPAVAITHSYRIEP